MQICVLARGFPSAVKVAVPQPRIRGVPGMRFFDCRRFGVKPAPYVKRHIVQPQRIVITAHSRFPIFSPWMALPCFHRCNRLALMALHHQTVVALGFCFGPWTFFFSTKCHIWGDLVPVSVCCLETIHFPEVITIFESSFDLTSANDVVTARHFNTRQAHEVQAIGFVEVYQHFNPGRRSVNADTDAMTQNEI